MNTISHEANHEFGNQLTKIRIVLPEDAWHQVEAEWLWAQKMEEDIYAVRNVPFYAMGVSYDDRVRVENRGGAPTVEAVVSRGGHSTYRIFAKQGYSNPRVQILFKELNHLHCDMEIATERLIAVDVFPNANIHAVYATLRQSEQDGIIDFQEGHCGHPLSK